MAYDGKPADDSATQLEDADWLAIVRAEREQAVGLDATGEGSSELSSDRERALEYAKGQMDDLPSLPNRSAAVSTDVNDAIETVLPDIMEVLTGGDDVATFRPVGEDDVEQAAQETDYVNHVLFNENPGWLAIYTKVKDALTVKLGVVKVYGETYETVEEEQFEGRSALEMQMIQEELGEEAITDLVAGEPDPITGEALWSFTLRTTNKDGKVCVTAVPPEDFAVARDTVILRDATYCVMRSRPRAQQLIADGYDREEVEALPAYGSANGETMELARDTAGEHADGASLITSGADFNLHQVEIHEHYIRVDADGDGTPELWCVVTAADETVLLKKERVNAIPFAVSTPYIVPHRLFGRSLADLMMEIQKIKTALVRLMLDSGYFAMNQRYEVATATGRANQFTISDLLNNIPGAPVRSNDGQSVRPLGGSRLDFDVTGALEYVSTMGEQRSGIVRNAQGLNPDTLHDTAKGAAMLAGAAMKRVRMICRVFAETGIKDMILLIHDAARTCIPSSRKVELRGKWVDVNPSEWSSRNNLTIHVGIGSGGRDMELVALNMVADRQAQLVELQGGTVTPESPYIKPDNIYATMKRLVELAGLKTPSLYVSEPPKADPNAQPEPPPPDPEVVKAQMEAQASAAELAQKGQLEREKMQMEADLKREQMAGEFALERERMNLQARSDLIAGAVSNLGRQTELGGDPG